ncbi:prepilin-type N-terminal cleavage/methylation domain-containing protein [Exilibacterium tricleocarpae]|uniref:Prepilin-type N-terminal cleavage/methylation domain-containing protein n=1 Tax=Exilibacterium tricleocarpae TaxID=2591008 RepID=A0A545TQG7_9GAMM|nr:pilin [Exilibacterium tricleocarpae]TQV79460.1 prepilin-type N-terminal cleavage/methylation domain-containing protein [Exilibacterium tricleocarpae]
MKNVKKAVQKGFTLIELMIVVAIIGILASIALPAYQDYTIRTQVTEGLNLAAEVKTAVGDFWSARGGMPLNNQSAGVSLPTSITGNYVTQVAVTNGAILITYGNRVNANISTQTLGLTPYVNNAGGIVWVCGTAPAPDANDAVLTDNTAATTGNLTAKYTPSECRP